MRRIIFSVYVILVSCLYAQNSSAQNPSTDGYNIRVQVKPFHKQQIYIGHYFGGYIHIVDSVTLNERSEATFKDSVKLPEGIYAIFYPDRSFMCDVMIDTLQHFSINAERSAPGKLTLQFINSPGNTLLDQYEHYMIVQGATRQAAQQNLQHAGGKIDSAVWAYKLSMIDDSIQNFREAVIKKIPGTVLSRLFIAMREVKIPASLKAPKSAADSAAVKQFISDHYWDGVNFWDGSLTYSPFFEDKFDKYFNEVLPNNEDTAIKKIDWMMSYATASETMTEFLLRRLLYGIINHGYRWGDRVYVYLFENYVAPQTYTWLTGEELRIMTERAYVLMGKTAGAPAPDINLPGLDGKDLSLYSVNSSYTLLCFWAPTCGHCQAILPRVDSMYLKKWKYAGVKIFSIGNETDGTRDEWINFISAHKLQEWVNVFYSNAEIIKRNESKLPDYVDLYEVSYFPCFFLLDKDKNFIAKRLKFEQIVDLLDIILKQKR